MNLNGAKNAAGVTTQSAQLKVNGNYMNIIPGRTFMVTKRLCLKILISIMAKK